MKSSSLAKLSYVMMVGHIIAAITAHTMGDDARTILFIAGAMAWTISALVFDKAVKDNEEEHE